MPLRFRQTFTLFPGVRINVGKTGISASIGIPGATLNLGRRGPRATVGIPGTGLSYSARLTGQAPNHSPEPTSPTSQPNVTPDNGPIYIPDDGMREIGSASVEQLTSNSLIPLRDMLLKARDQKKQIIDDLSVANAELVAQKAELGRCKRNLLRFFYRKRIAEIESQIPVTESEFNRLKDWLESTKISVSFEANATAQQAFSAMIRAFDALRMCHKIWDITADRDTNRILERTFASRTVARFPVSFEFSSADLIQFSGRAMHFSNVNGEDILIYPGVAVLPRPDGLFALIDIRELDIDFTSVNFVEDEEVPSDTKIVGHTWAKTNKDGTPDRRFRDNFQIPVVEYGRLTFSSPSGVTEEYQVSNPNPALAFAEAVRRYKAALSEGDTPISGTKA